MKHQPCMPTQFLTGGLPLPASEAFSLPLPHADLDPATLAAPGEAGNGHPFSPLLGFEVADILGLSRSPTLPYRHGHEIASRSPHSRPPAPFLPLT